MAQSSQQPTGSVTLVCRLRSTSSARCLQRRDVTLFDAAANGYAREEDYAAMYLKKSAVALSEALPIRAMIRGTAVNANGKTGGANGHCIIDHVNAVLPSYVKPGIIGSSHVKLSPHE
ncbi:hypothetical protein HD806DRAFT_539076 [Xylariaceae sp. AK1471]|nr:hypothetical protein HD806DRAFT_539076 [Xylariaceae sp. AK1471]